MNFNGEAGERAVMNSDNMGELIPASADYANHGTTFFYYGLNETNNQPNWRICWVSMQARDLPGRCAHLFALA